MFGRLSSAKQDWRLIALTDYFACWFNSPPPPRLSHPATHTYTPLIGHPLREGRNRSQPGHGGRGEAALTTPSGGAAQPDEAGVRRVRGRDPDGAPRPAGQPAGSPALSRKALSPRLLWGSPWEGAGALAQLRSRRGRAEKNPKNRNPTSNPHLEEDNGVGRGGGKTGRTTRPTCRPGSRFFLREANPRLCRAALPQLRRGDKDEEPPRPRRRRLQHRGQRPPRPAALSGRFSTGDRDSFSTADSGSAMAGRAAPRSAPRL